MIKKIVVYIHEWISLCNITIGGSIKNDDTYNRLNLVKLAKTCPSGDGSCKNSDDENTGAVASRPLLKSYINSEGYF